MNSAPSRAESQRQIQCNFGFSKLPTFNVKTPSTHEVQLMEDWFRASENQNFDFWDNILIDGYREEWLWLESIIADALECGSSRRWFAISREIFASTPEIYISKNTRNRDEVKEFGYEIADKLFVSMECKAAFRPWRKAAWEWGQIAFAALARRIYSAQRKAETRRQWVEARSGSKDAKDTGDVQSKNMKDSIERPSEFGYRKDMDLRRYSREGMAGSINMGNESSQNANIILNVQSKKMQDIIERAAGFGRKNVDLSWHTNVSMQESMNIGNNIISGSARQNPSFSEELIEPFDEQAKSPERRDDHDDEMMGMDEGVESTSAVQPIAHVVGGEGGLDEETRRRRNEVDLGEIYWKSKEGWTRRRRKKKSSHDGTDTSVTEQTVSSTFN